MGAQGLIIFGDLQHFAGSAPDTTPQILDINPEAMRIDIAIFDNTALITFSKDGRNFSAPREFPAGIIASLDLRVRKMSIVNKVIASPARYDITAYYDPITINGRTYDRQY